MPCLLKYIEDEGKCIDVTLTLAEILSGIEYSMSESIYEGHSPGRLNSFLPTNNIGYTDTSAHSQAWSESSYP